MKIRKWRQAERDKAVIIELEIGWHELHRLVYSQGHDGKQLNSKLLDLLAPISDQAEEPN